MKNITFFTQCYEKDWHAIVNQGAFARKVENLNYDFFKKILIITNVKDRKSLEESLSKLIEDGTIDEYFFTDDYSDKVLEFFDIKMDSFNGGYWYSIGPLLAVYLCDTEYMIYLTGDSITEKKDYDWISEGIKILETDNKVKVVNPVWNLQYEAAKNDENDYIRNGTPLTDKNTDWSYGMGFSDQCFLIPTNTFKSQIYNEQNNLSDMTYPGYAGDSFEKRVSSYLKNNKLYRITSNYSTYFHPRWF
jgi:hypothetical protein